MKQLKLIIGIRTLQLVAFSTVQLMPMAVNWHVMKIHFVLSIVALK